MTRRACKRCEVKPGIPAKVLARVDDAFFYDTIEEHTALCAYCRAAAQRENKIASQYRQSPRDQQGRWYIRNDRLIVVP